jgi:endonuclease G
LLLLSALFFSAPPAWSFIDVNLQMQLGNPSGAITDTNNHDHYLVQRAVQALDYSDNLGEPVWASWDLTAGDIGTNARSSSFFPDTNLPPNFYRVTDNDYNGVGTNNLNRGHMCPSEDRTDTRADNDAVFLMSNIIPQNGTNNSGVWGTFEGYCRDQTVSNEVLIICGPSGFGTNRIPSGKAVIPDYVWKIAVFVRTNTGTALSRITATNRVIALKIPNAYPVTNKWQSFITSAAQIEVDTGFTFFTALPTDVANALRNKVDGQTNPPPAIYAFSPTSGGTNTSVVITGTNFTGAMQVTFNGASATFTVNSNTQVTATAPANATSGYISVTTPSGTAISTNSFTVTGTTLGTTYAGVLVGWDVSGQSGFGTSPLAPTTNAPNLNIVGLTRGSGVTTSGTGKSRAWGGTGFTNLSEAAAVSASQYVYFSLSVSNGYKVSITNLSRFDYFRSPSGATNGVLQFQVGTGVFTDITNYTYSPNSNGATNPPIDLSGYATLQNIGAGTNVTFRIVNYNAGGSSGTWYVYDYASSSALDFAIAGTVTQLPEGIVPVMPPVISLHGYVNGQFQFAITGTTGSNYIVQAATNLASPVWASIWTNAAPFVFIESNMNLSPQRFYRAMLPQ